MAKVLKKDFSAIYSILIKLGQGERVCFDQVVVTRSKSDFWLVGPQGIKATDGLSAAYFLSGELRWQAIKELEN